jgi:hypothetical protein
MAYMEDIASIHEQIFNAPAQPGVIELRSKRAEGFQKKKLLNPKGIKPSSFRVEVFLW